MKLKKPACVLAGILITSIVLSAVHPFGNPRSSAHSGDLLLEGSQVPGDVRSTLQRKCGDCHSENTRYPLYSHLAPVSWVIDHDIVVGRERFDMSRWRLYGVEGQIDALTRMASEVHTGQMPPKNYVRVHPRSQLSPEEEQRVYEWAKSERRRLRQELSSNVVKPIRTEKQ